VLHTRLNFFSLAARGAIFPAEFLAAVRRRRKGLQVGHFDFFSTLSPPLHPHLENKSAILDFSPPLPNFSSPLSFTYTQKQKVT
jgi:hypothetical protein